MIDDISDIAAFYNSDPTWLVNLAGTLADSGDLTTARMMQEESLALRRALGDPRGIAHSLTNLGDSLHRAGDDDAARACLEESLAIGRAGRGQCMASDAQE